MTRARTTPARIVSVGVAAILCLILFWLVVGSRLPGTYSALDMGIPEVGRPVVGGDANAGHAGGHHAGSAVGQTRSPAAGRVISVADLHGDRSRPADVVFHLVAARGQTTLADGRAFEGYTINGSTPGPVLEVVEGQLVEVRFRNDNIPGGATLHWHGLDVPGGEDGVAGVTQDAVRPGGEHIYRFTADQVGTYWYHSHQISHEQVIGGLLGALVVRSRPESTSAVPDTDVVALVHAYAGRRTLNGDARGLTRVVEPGRIVRVRLVNTDNGPTTAWVSGTAYKIVAVDGQDLSGPTEVSDRSVVVTAGGRGDLQVMVPSGGVRVELPGISVALGPTGSTPPRSPAPRQELDLLTYGTPADLGFDPTTPDRVFDYDIGRRFGFLDGRPGLWWTINGGIVPHVPMFIVTEGDVVVMRIRNDSGDVHPMHLHGHHVTVLERDGVKASGSPWRLDSLNVRDGETWTVAFVADNPGIWMDHCHNLEHESSGMMRNYRVA